MAMLLESIMSEGVTPELVEEVEAEMGVHDHPPAGWSSTSGWYGKDSGRWWMFGTQSMRMKRSSEIGSRRPPNGCLNDTVDIGRRRLGRL